MACIIKTPSSKSKGVISLTNIEYFGQIKKNPDLLSLIEELKKDWIFCYHPNWEDHNFHDNGLFDCVISVKGSFSFDLASTGHKQIIETCSNRMSPLEFKTLPIEDKIWDFCHVSREQASKNIRGFFRVVKRAFDIRPDLKGVLIISVEDSKEMHDIRSAYEKTFTAKEREQFEFITLSYNLPFPLSKKILAHFYNYSKVALNTHLDEPHGRVVGYGLACGMPIVGYQRLGEMVDKEINRKPIFYLSTQGDESSLAIGLCDALNYVDNEYRFSEHRAIADLFSENIQGDYLKKNLIKLFDLDNEGWNIYNLDSRLSTHYICEPSTNSYSASVFELMYYLRNMNISSTCIDEDKLEDRVREFSKQHLGTIRLIQHKISVRYPIELHKIKRSYSSTLPYRQLIKIKKSLKNLKG